MTMTIERPLLVLSLIVAALILWRQANEVKGWEMFRVNAGLRPEPVYPICDEAKRWYERCGDGGFYPTYKQTQAVSDFIGQLQSADVAGKIDHANLGLLRISR